MANARSLFLASTGATFAAAAIALSTIPLAVGAAALPPTQIVTDTNFSEVFLDPGQYGELLPQ
ncbi:hypothetical protein JGU71_18695 [Antrihabitans sp. YC3-6]|uniref:Uncharacterized protein n=1 Tax=Antrihabitans stalagmiti TaxID=2799499 RepID=A0A934NTB5_9NOCA|nr:hypothetical protein [Antrihabitans stalagmiti]MBJ8340917.1 hypothetical protein [Antrihabitans stalagmiti]